MAARPFWGKVLTADAVAFLRARGLSRWGGVESTFMHLRLNLAIVALVLSGLLIVTCRIAAGATVLL